MTYRQDRNVMRPSGYRALRTAGATMTPDPGQRELVHHCPPEGEVRLLCCQQMSTDFPWYPYLTLDPALVTCQPAED